MMRLCVRLAALALCVLAAGASRAQNYPSEVPADLSPEAARRRIAEYAFYERPATASAAEVELGRKLFFDGGLSASGRMSCSTCHQPEHHYGDGRPRAVGREGKRLARNTPSLLTATYSTQLAWDGRSGSIEESALAAISNPDEMAEDPAALAARLQNSSAYAAEFAAAYGPVGISSATIGRALAAFVISLKPAEDSPWDRFQRDGVGLSTGALRGVVLFAGRGGCIQCHPSKNLQHIGMFANTGISPDSPVDVGRYRADPRPMMWGAFRVPSLRNVALTAPYMHDGSLKTLKDVVDFYDRGGDARDRYQDSGVRELHFSERDKADLVAFLESLTSESLK
jgi:cytochrome c peroxidase